MIQPPETGLFYRRSSDDFVVLWKGQQIAHYDSIESFIDAHLDGLRALEANQADLLLRLYRDV